MDVVPDVNARLTDALVQPSLVGAAETESPTKLPEQLKVSRTQENRAADANSAANTADSIGMAPPVDQPAGDAAHPARAAAVIDAPRRQALQAAAVGMLAGLLGLAPTSDVGSLTHHFDFGER